MWLQIGKKALSVIPWGKVIGFIGLAASVISIYQWAKGIFTSSQYDIIKKQTSVKLPKPVSEYQNIALTLKSQLQEKWYQYTEEEKVVRILSTLTQQEYDLVKSIYAKIADNPLQEELTDELHSSQLAQLSHLIL